MPFITRIRLRRSWLEAAVSEHPEGVLKQIVRDLNRLQDEGVSRSEILEVIQSYVPDDILCLPSAGVLRQQLSADGRIKLYLRAGSRAVWLTDETARLTSQASVECAGQFWLEVGKCAAYQGLLQRYAPALFKDQSGTDQSS